MQTILLYLLIMLVVVAVVFAVVWFAFGRGEDLPPLERDATLTSLPSSGIAGSDVRSLRFALTFRGYKQGEVDWALARLAAEIDDLRAVLIDLHARDERDCAADATVATSESGHLDASSDALTTAPAATTADPTDNTDVTDSPRS